MYWYGLCMLFVWSQYENDYIILMLWLNQTRRIPIWEENSSQGSIHALFLYLYLNLKKSSERVLLSHNQRIHFSFPLSRNIVVCSDTVKMQSRIALLLIIGIISCNAFPGKYRLILSIFLAFHFFHRIDF